MKTLQPNEAIALCAAELEESVSNQRMQQFCDLHPRDITKMLQGLVDRGFFDVHGVTSGTYYTLRDAAAGAEIRSDAIAQVVASDRAGDDVVKQAIIDVAVDFMSPQQIAERLNRSPETFRRRHIPELVKEGRLEPKFRSLNNPRQMYRASAERLDEVEPPAEPT